MSAVSILPKHSRVHAHTIKRGLELTLELPLIQRQGFTHPEDGNYLMLPREFFKVLAYEPKSVTQVIMEILDQTIGWVGNGRGGRREWVRLSYGHFARKGLLSQGAAQRGIQQALTKGYLRRRARGKPGGKEAWEYAINWKDRKN